MLTFYKSIYILNFIILLTSSSPIPLFYDRFSRIYGLTIYATPFPLITLGLNARLGTTVPTTTTTTTTQNSIINGTVPTNIVNVSAPIPPDVVTTVSTLLPINNVRIATTPMVLGPLGSRLNIGQGSVAIQIEQLNVLAQAQQRQRSGTSMSNMGAMRLSRKG